MHQQKKKHILLTNDDGYKAEGINRVFEALSQHFDVTICAPRENESAHSHSITITKPVHAQPFERGFSVAGTPVDAVHLAMADLVKKPINFVVSGMNHGANLGDDYYYSGTLAAAREAAFYSVPSFGLSMHNFNNEIAKKHAHFFAQYLLEHQNQCQAGQLYSFNFPENESVTIKNSSLGRYIRDKMPLEKFESDRTPGAWYWIGHLERGDLDDFHLIKNGDIALTIFDFRKSILGQITNTCEK